MSADFISTVTDSVPEALMNNAAARSKTQITIGLELGDRRHTYFI